MVIHKIDRSARNLKDWADLGELIDSGIEVHFANESLDLTSRGGRLSADIQAVVAADFIRNLREETRKGFYGRLKQGLYPLPAPIGYVDCGRGLPKEPDPVRAPLVKHLFEFYATGNVSLEKLSGEANRIGLMNKNDRPISRNGLSTILNNRFYMGIIHIKRTDELFKGVHAVLIPPSLFNRVQLVLRGKTNLRTTTHNFLFKQLFKCDYCRYSLIGEKQKSFIYYRCHTKSCPTTCIREDEIERVAKSTLQKIDLDDEIKGNLFSRVIEQIKNEDVFTINVLKSHRLHLRKMESKLDNLTDAVVERLIDKKTFKRKQSNLLNAQGEIEERIRELEHGNETTFGKVKNFLERAYPALLTYQTGNTYDKREVVNFATSNRVVRGKNVVIELSLPAKILTLLNPMVHGDPCRDVPRTLDGVLDELVSYFSTSDSSTDI